MWNWHSFLHGQGYNGQFKGVLALIAKKYPTTIIYVHNVSHSFNLVLSNVAKVYPIENAFGIIEKIYTFFNYV